jgi:hypothetical protein
MSAADPASGALQPAAAVVCIFCCLVPRLFHLQVDKSLCGFTCRAMCWLHGSGSWSCMRLVASVVGHPATVELIQGGRKHAGLA